MANTLTRKRHAYVPIVLLLLLLLPIIASGQRTFRGRLINTFDSTAVAYAGVQVEEINAGVSTDENGLFELTIPDAVKDITLKISAIGYKGISKYHPKFRGVEKIYISIAANSLDGVSIRALSPEDVVRKAVAAIKDNYQGRSYFAYSSYRKYDRINNVFRNLMEGNVVILMRLLQTKRGIEATEGYASTRFRNLVQFRDDRSFIEDNPTDLMPENPIYHIEKSAINPNRIVSYKFSFDTTQKAGDYIVNYVNEDYSCEHHGLVTSKWIWGGESYETGRLVIDSRTFAIKRIERNAYRNPYYKYAKGGAPNNVVCNGNYQFEFVDGRLIADYEPIGDKWFLTQLNYTYTDNLFKTFFGHGDYNYTTCFEWRLDSVTRAVPANLRNEFHNRLIREEFTYNSEAWKDFNFPFYFFSKDSVYSYIERRGPVDQQFYEQGREDEKEYLLNRP